MLVHAETCILHKQYEYLMSGSSWPVPELSAMRVILVLCTNCLRSKLHQQSRHPAPSRRPSPTMVLGVAVEPIRHACGGIVVVLSAHTQKNTEVASMTSNEVPGTTAVGGQA